MKDVKEIRLGWEPSDAVVLHTLDQKAQSHSPGKEMTILKGGHLETLRITLTNGRVIDIELFERIPGHINITGDDIVVRPGSGNLVSITHAKPNYKFEDEK